MRLQYGDIRKPQKPHIKHRKYARKLSIAAVDKARKQDLRMKLDPALRRRVVSGRERLDTPPI